MNFAEYFKSAINKSNISYRKLGEKSGVDFTYISKIANNKMGPPSPEILKKLAPFLVVSYEDLMKAAGYIEYKPTEQSNVTPVEMVTLPILGEIHAGRPLFADEHLKGKMPFPKKMLTPGYKHFLLEVEGDSMIGDGIQPGDIVLVRVQNYIDHDGQIAAVIINGEEACLKHVYNPEGSDMAILRASNPEYKDIVYPIKELIINGVYSGVFKKPKTNQK